MRAVTWSGTAAPLSTKPSVPPSQTKVPAAKKDDACPSVIRRDTAQPPLIAVLRGRPHGGLGSRSLLTRLAAGLRETRSGICPRVAVVLGHQSLLGHTRIAASELENPRKNKPKVGSPMSTWTQASRDAARRSLSTVMPACPGSRLSSASMNVAAA
jgi:hypothetical protein